MESYEINQVLVEDSYSTIYNATDVKGNNVVYTKYHINESSEFDLISNWH